jgi:hypothetical protein
MRLIGLEVVLALTLFLDPLLAVGQQPAKVYRIGYLSFGRPSDERERKYLDSFRQGLRDLGYLEGRNLVLEIRYAEGNRDQLPDLAAVRLKVDLIVASNAWACPHLRDERDAAIVHNSPAQSRAAETPIRGICDSYALAHRLASEP